MFRKTNLVLASIALMSVGVISGCGAPAQNTANNTTPSQSSTPGSNTANSTNPAANQTPDNLQTTTQRWKSPPAMQIDLNKQYQAVFHTNFGDFTVQLFAKDSPHTVNNFVFLADHHFYHDDKFFRIIQSFMIQTGDPNNNGTGGPGYQFKDELPPKHPYQSGIVAMANAGPNTNGSQFFICTGADSTGLPPNYTVFGQVTSGMSVVEKIAAIPVVQNPMTGEASDPTQTAYIQSVDIVVK